MNATIRATDLQALIDALPHLVWVCRADGAAEYFNARWRDYTGLDLDSSRGDGWRAAVHADQASDLASAWRAAGDDTQEWHVLYRLRRHDGAFRWFEARARRVLLEGHVRPHWIGTSTDIDEQHRALDTVQAQERRYRALIEYLPDAFFVHDESGSILDVNRHASDLTGRSREELLALRITDLDAHFDETLLRAQWRAAKPGDTWEAQSLSRHRDGHVTDIDAHVVCYRYGDEKLFLSLVRDVTARLAEAAALRQRSALLELAPVFVFDLEGRIHYWSRGAESLSGFSREEAEAATIGALLKPRFPQPFETIVEQLRRTGEWRGELGATVAGGRAIVVLSQWTLYQDAQLGQPLILQVHADITELKRAESALVAARAAVQDAMQRGGAGTWRWDARSNCIEWDAATMALLSLDPQATGGGARSFDDALALLHIDDREATAAALRAAIDGGEALHLDARLQDNAQGPRWIDVRGAVERDRAGRVVALAGVVNDVTARVLAERALAASREEVRAYSQQLDAAVEAERLHIARELHDELGQRLTTLKLDLHWLRDYAGSRAMFDSASIGRLRAMENIIDETITETRSLSASLRPIGLEQLGLKSAIETMVAGFAARTGLRARASVDGSAHVPTEHKLAVYRIVQEALTNVARHSRASEVEVLLGRVDSAVRVEVHDNGVGLGPATDERARLGIVGMRERARAIGGRLDIDGGGDEGTSVVLEIPQ